MREFQLLQHIFARNSQLPESVTIPPGDDMGAVDFGGQSLLVAVDQVIDGVHVDSTTTPIELIGRKAITRNLSDVAAMAAIPVGTLAAASLPRDLADDQQTRLADSMRETASAFGCPLIGGDLSFTDGPLLIAVTILARPSSVPPVLRSGAKAGDTIFVTGSLGGAWGCGRGAAEHHLCFEPRIAVASKLVGQRKIPLSSMIDLSDGLAGDLGHICKQSDASALVRVDQIPIRSTAQTRSITSGWPAWWHAMTDGEDYELCFTVPSTHAQSVPTEIDGVRITPIGVIRDTTTMTGVNLAFSNGQQSPFLDSGWEHASSG